MSAPAPDTPHRSRTVYAGIFERWVMSGVIVVTFGWIALFEVFAEDETVVGLVYAAIGAAAFWILVVRIMLRIGETTLTVRNPVRTYVVQTADVVSADPAYSGLRLTLSNGKGVTVAAVQRHNIAVWLRRRTRADRIAEEILERARQLRARN